MSNLYKQRHVVSKQNEARIIDSNEKIAQKLLEASRIAAEKAKAHEVDGLVPEMVEIPSMEDEIVPATLEEVREEAARLIEEAQEKANALVEKAEQQVQDIREQAKKEGHQEGYQAGYGQGSQKAEEELQIEKAGLSKRANQLEEDYKRNMMNLEPELVHVITDVFENVFHVYFDDKKDVLLYLVEKAVLNIENTKEFHIRVSEENYRFLDDHKSEIKDRVGPTVHLDFVADSQMKENQCIIETDTGVFDCSLGVQLENLIKTLRALSL